MISYIGIVIAKISNTEFDDYFQAFAHVFLAGIFIKQSKFF